MNDILSAIESINPHAIVGMLIPLAGILIVPVIFYLVQRSKIERERLWHETARVALEKGQPLPPYVSSCGRDEPGTDRAFRPWYRSPSRDVRTGLIMLAVGVGIFFGSDDGNRGTHMAAYIVGGIGLARLIFGLVGLLGNSDKTKS